MEDGDERLILAGQVLTYMLFVWLLRLALVSLGVMLVWPESAHVLVWFTFGGVILANRMRFVSYRNQRVPFSRRMVLMGLLDAFFPVLWDRLATPDPSAGPMLWARCKGPYRNCVWGIRVLSVAAVLYLLGPAWWWLPFLYIGTSMMLRALRQFGSLREEVPSRRILAHLLLDLVNPVFV